MTENAEKLTLIESVEELKFYLKEALVLEHATIPTYLTTLYSIEPGTNFDASAVLRVVLVEEMLHLTLAANLLNAIDGTPSLTYAGFVPNYPTYLPDGEADFVVNLDRFSQQALNNFLQIERPAKRHPTQRLTQRSEGQDAHLAPTHLPELKFYSIGDFYAEIARGFQQLHEELGDALFSGDRSRQITPEFYYSGGGSIIPVYDIESALKAVTFIAEQGEGEGGAIADEEGEISHFYRIQQLLLGRYYLDGDEVGQPSGDSISVNWEAAYPIKANAKLSDYGSERSELYQAAAEFNRLYANFLGEVEVAFTGHPDRLVPAMAGMFRIKELASQLMRNPIPGTEWNAAPTFEMPGNN